MSLMSVISKLAPDYTTSKYGQHITYNFNKLKLTFYSKGKKTEHIFLNQSEIKERHFDDCKTIVIEPDKASDRWRKNQLLEIIEKYGDTIQFENHDAYILARCNMSKADLTDIDTYFEGYMFKENRKGINEIKINFI